MIKRILVTLGRSEYSQAAIEMGIQIAKTHKAELTGIVVLDAESIKKSVGSMPAGAIKLAKKMEESPMALQLRYLQTLVEIGSENNTTTLFPIPIDLLSAIAGKKK